MPQVKRIPCHVTYTVNMVKAVRLCLSDLLYNKLFLSDKPILRHLHQITQHDLDTSEVKSTQGTPYTICRGTARDRPKSKSGFSSKQGN